MTAIYQGTRVRVIRVETHRAYIVWHGMVKRVNRQELSAISPQLSARCGELRTEQVQEVQS